MSPDRNEATRRERRTIEAEKVGGREVTTENGKLVEGEDKTKNKMLTTEVTEVTENEYRKMIKCVKGRGRLARGPRTESGRGCGFLILVQESPIESNDWYPSNHRLEVLGSGNPHARVRGKAPP